MPVPTTVTAGGTQETTKGGGNRADQKQVATVPFIRASQLHREPCGIDVSRQLLTSDQDLGVFDIPAYGFLRAIVIEVTSTGGTGTAVTLTEDAPWNVIKNIALTEPNGATLSAVTSGYSLYLIDKYGGYRGYNDPKSGPVYSTSVGTSANVNFMLRIPVEMSTRDAVGSLPNQNSGATFKLRLTLAAIAQVFGGTVSVAPTVRVKVSMECWDQPEPSTAGAMNQTTPPAVNTTQFWTEQVYNLNSGAVTQRLSRVGNYLRNVIFVARRTAGTRANGQADWPDPGTVYLDTRPLDIVTKNSWLNQIYERYGALTAAGSATFAFDSAGGLDNGVFPYDFCHEFDGVVGHENRDLWLPTLSSSRLELQGTFANADTLTVLTNDVAVAGSVFL